MKQWVGQRVDNAAEQLPACSTRCSFGNVRKGRAIDEVGILAAAAILSLHVPSEARGPAHATVITNRTLGLRITKPAGWRTLTADAREESLEALDDPGMRAVSSLAGAADLELMKFA